MSEHRYTAAALTPDYVRACAGILLTAGPLAVVNPLPTLAYVLGALALLFVLFAARTAIRHMTTIRLTSVGIQALGPFGVAIEWSELSKMELRYFSTRRNRSKGWMQLRLRGGRVGLRLDSNVEAFESVAARAAEEARSRGVALDDSTRANLTGLGSRLGDRHAPEAA